MAVTDVLDKLDIDRQAPKGGSQGGSAIRDGQPPTLILLVADLVSAAIAVPLALVLLSIGSSVTSNSLRHFWQNVGADASFPTAVVIA
jgi:hypothetical protein